MSMNRRAVIRVMKMKRLSREEIYLNFETQIFGNLYIIHDIIYVKRELSIYRLFQVCRSGL